MWRAYADAGQAPNPDDAQLATFAADRALTTLRAALRSINEQGIVLKGSFESEPRAVDAVPAHDPSLVEIRDCLDGTGIVAYRASAEGVDGEPGGRHEARATVSKVEPDRWKVTTFAIRRVGTC